MTCQKNGSHFTPEEIMVFQFRGYVIPFMVFFGLIGHSLVISAFSLMQRRQPSRFNVYVICIAVFQVIDMITNGFLDDFLGRGLMWISDCTTLIKLDTTSSFMCKIFSYVPKSSCLIANTMLVLFSFDRLLTAYKPIRFRGNHYLNLLKVLIGVVIVLSLILFSPQIIYNDLTPELNPHGITNYTCQYVNSLFFGVQYTLYLSIIGIHIAPTLLIATANTLIVIKLHSLNRDHVILCAKRKPSNNEMRRIIGHLVMTYIYLFFSFPLVVLIILRQQSDFANYKLSHPIYATRLVHLSRLFSSFDIMTYLCQFPTFFIFLPNFRVMVLRIVCCSPCLRNRPRIRKMLQRIERSSKTSVNVMTDMARFFKIMAIRRQSTSGIYMVNFPNTSDHSLD